MRRMVITLVVGIAALSALSSRATKVWAAMTAEERGAGSALNQRPILETPSIQDARSFEIFLSLLKTANSKPLPITGQRDNDWVAAAISDLESSDAELRPGNAPREAGKSGAAPPSQRGSTFGDFTVFAPNDAAFGSLPKGKLETLRKDPERLKAFLRAHITPTKVMLADMLASPGGGSTKMLKSFSTLDGSSVGIWGDPLPEKVLIQYVPGRDKFTGPNNPLQGGTDLSTPAGEQVPGGKGTGKVVRGDIPAGRGVIHVIDALLVEIAE